MNNNLDSITLQKYKKNKSAIMSSEDSLLHPTNPRGIGALTATLFIVGEIAGTGVLALPEALKTTGWVGVFLMLLVCGGSAYSGVVLGRSWIILEERDSQSPGSVGLSKVKTRNPYAMIGETAWGRKGKVISTLTLVVQLFGGSIVSLLLSAEMAQNLLTPLFPALLGEITFCEWIVIMAVILLPFSFFGSPVDFWPIAFCAMSSTAVASVLIVIAIFVQPSSTTTNQPTIALLEQTPLSSTGYTVTLSTILLGIGTMNFSFSGAACMPTIQNDMKDKRRFGVSVVLAYVILIFIYLPVSIVGYHFYGNSVQSNVIRNLYPVDGTNPTPLVRVIEVLIAIHVLCAYLILLNPVNLNLENFLGVHHSFNIKRCLSRVSITLLALLIGLTVPKFGKLLNLVGASAVTMQSLTLPCWFYYRLSKQNVVGQELGAKSRWVIILLWTIVLFSIFIAISSSVSALLDLFDPNAFSYPCFVRNCRHI